MFHLRSEVWTIGTGNGLCCVMSFCYEYQVLRDRARDRVGCDVIHVVIVTHHHRPQEIAWLSQLDLVIDESC